MRDHRNAATEVAKSFEVPKLVRGAQSAFDQGDLQSAIGLLTKAAALSPRDSRLQASLGSALWLAEMPAEAEQAFNVSLRLEPTEPSALFGMGEIKFAANDLEEAEDYFRRALSVDPQNMRAHLFLVECMTAQGKLDEAESEAKLAIAAHPLESAPLSAYGTRLQQLGRFDEAQEHFVNAIALDACDGPAYWGIAQQQRFKDSDRELVRTMESVLANPQLTRPARKYVLFALGKAHDDLKEYERAMAFFLEANRLVDQDLIASQPFSSAEHTRTIDTIRALFTAEFIQSRKAPNDFSPKPIFIVGMMRSGTTLVEQILSSHASVAAGGEIPFWTTQTLRCIDFDRNEFDINRALGARKKYNKRLRTISPTARFVTDKMPNNYRVLGALSMLYPDSKFILCTRHPVDTCLSIFMTAFSQPADFSSDLDKMAFVYRQYQSLMDHWRSALPLGTLLEVKYEDLIEDRERVTREIIQHCGLEWDESCLRHEDNSRAVSTASLWQVRQPVYRTSVDRWRNYEPWLGPLQQLLDPGP